MGVHRFLNIHEEIRAILNLIEDHRRRVERQKTPRIGKGRGPDIRKLK
jgi:hypothetical protein